MSFCTKITVFICLSFLNFSSLHAHNHEGETQIFVLMGCPGSGKGTFSQYMTQYGFKHYSTGDILRDQVKNKTPVGIKYKEDILAGRLIPWSEVTKLIKALVEQSVARHEKIILDGYPQSSEQVTSLDQILEEAKLKEKTKFIYLSVDQNLALSRISDRLVCGSCKHVYNLKNYKPKVADICDQCGAKLEKRVSDEDAHKVKRINRFFSETINILDLYKNNQRGELITIDASHLIEDLPGLKNKLLASQKK